jgi:hypothetical protein
MSGIITRHFRLHNAEQFRESFSETASTRYFLYVGKNVAYANGSQIHGTVKCTTGSNTIVGTNTYFTTDLSVGDTIRITGLSNQLRVHAIQSAQTLIATSQPLATIAVAANAYIRYLFSEINPTTPVDSYQETYFDIWRNMIAAKRIQASDVSSIVPQYNWTNNTVYTQYTDTDPDLPTKQFYVITSDGNVYKCIDNNLGGYSTSKPTGTGTSIISTSDGYRWKYMYTVTSASSLKFSTVDWIPVQTLTSNNGSAQWNVQQTAANGAIHHIEVVANGYGYLTASNTFYGVSNSTVLKLAPSSSGVDDIYNGSAIFIKTGAGSGQIRTIINYSGANNILTVNSAFVSLPNTSSQYLISPRVIVRGDSGAVATAYASNTYGGQVRKITMISTGASYSTANVVVSANVGRGATAKAIISPLGGHGSDAVDELFGSNIMLNVRLTGSEANTFPSNNDFRIIGIMRDPLLNNGQAANTTHIDQTHRVTIKNVAGDFRADEIVVGSTSGASGRLVVFANTNAARTEGVLKIVNLITNGTGGKFSPGERVTGLSSTITANVVSYTKPAMRPYSGFVIYNENRPYISRASDQTEDVKIIITF